MKKYQHLITVQFHKIMKSVKSHNPRLDGGQEWKSVIQTTLSYDIAKAHGWVISLNRALKSGTGFIINFSLAM